jgi:hypothetical protein
MLFAILYRQCHSNKQYEQEKFIRSHLHAKSGARILKASARSVPKYRSGVNTESS